MNYDSLPLIGPFPLAHPLILRSNLGRPIPVLQPASPMHDSSPAAHDDASDDVLRSSTSLIGAATASWEPEPATPAAQSSRGFGES